MDHELDRGPDHSPDPSPDVRSVPATPRTDTEPDDVDWVDAEVSLDECDGYVVVAVDPQTGEVDAHGPYGGLGAVHAAEDMRAVFEREELDDLVVRIVRWHTAQTPRAA